MRRMLEMQYEMVRDARNVLFQFCATIPQADLVSRNQHFGNGGSVRDLLVHIANVYEIWIAHRALQQPIPLTSGQSVSDMVSVQSVFNGIDTLMEQFIIKCNDDLTTNFRFEQNGSMQTISALMLFTHVITHEFHHKGQVLSISRRLGYIPVDTDIIH
jgi:uncharacterized damage-inducible protein DinB